MADGEPASAEPTVELTNDEKVAKLHAQLRAGELGPCAFAEQFTLVWDEKLKERDGAGSLSRGVRRHSSRPPAPVDVSID